MVPRRLAAAVACACTLAVPVGAQAHSPGEEYGTTAGGAGLTDGQFLHNMTLDAFFPAGEEGARPTSSDIAFWGDYAYVGNYNGFRIFDISERVPVLLSDERCVGAQGDPSVFDRTGDGAADTLVLSVDRTMTGPTCSATPAAHDDPEGWEGLRLFDVSDPSEPKFITGVYQDCGSHTNTLLPAPGKSAPESVYVLNASYPLRPGPTCGPVRGPEAGRDPYHGVVQVVEIPFAAPSQAQEIAELPVTYPGDADNVYLPIHDHGINGGEIGTSGLVDGMRACHDIAVFAEAGVVGAACGEQAQVWRINAGTGLPDTLNPMWAYDQPNVDFWHSATFSWDGKVANFIDESFGDGCPTTTVKRDLSTPDPDDVKEYRSGNMFFFDAASGELLSEYRIPRGTNDGRTGPGQYCSSHLGISVPSKDRHLLVNAYYRGGSSVIDYTDPYDPTEIAFADLPNTDTWSAYPYPRASAADVTQIAVYSNDGVSTPNDGYGFQRFTADIGRTRVVGLDHLNPQLQERRIDMKTPKPKARTVRTYAAGRTATKDASDNAHVIVREVGR